MALFHYRAIDGSGAVVTGETEAVDRAAAARWLQAEGCTPLRVDEERRSGLVDVLNFEITPKNALSTQDRVAFTRSLATLTGAGLPLDLALETLRDLGATKPVRAVSGRLLDRVRSGASLAEATEEDRAAFDPLYRGVVRAGEAGARLEETLEDLADLLEDGAKRRGELRSALIYPAFLLVTAIGSVGVLLAFVVPTFQPLLADAGVEPPAITQAVVAAGRFVEAHWAAMALAAAAAALGFRLAMVSPDFRRVVHRALLAAPLIGGPLLKMETARLARLLGALLTSGVALPAALRLSAGGLSNAALSAEIDRVIPEVEAGRGLAQPLREGGIAPPLALQLIQVGQASGDLAPMLGKIADTYAVEAKRAFDQMLALVTPLLTLIMGGLIALIISSILFALFSINQLAL